MIYCSRDRKMSGIFRARKSGFRRLLRAILQKPASSRMARLYRPGKYAIQRTGDRETVFSMVRKGDQDPICSWIRFTFAVTSWT
jgi:hypothetical protein